MNMKVITGKHVDADRLDRLSHIGDLINIEGPILSLLRDSRQNWLLFWCDTDGEQKQRYLLQPVARDELLRFLQKTISLRAVLKNNSPKYVLDVTGPGIVSLADLEKGPIRAHRYLKRIIDASQLDEYMPTEDSFFDEELSPDLTATAEYVPTAFDVRIDGEWFVTDLHKFAGLYEQLYDFFYCTEAKFVRNIGATVRQYLGSPWKGGFSRINLFKALKDHVPALHDLRIRQISYASPGEITIEALRSIGSTIARTMGNYLANRDRLLEIERKLNTFLSEGNLKKKDLSKFSDETLRLSVENREFLYAAKQEVGELLECATSLESLIEHSPNVIVSTKVVVAFLSRVKRLSQFEYAGLVGSSGGHRHDGLAGLESWAD
jgi:hypothetical protein